MPHVIAANEIKTKGITAFSKDITEGELFISVHGINKFVVVSIDKYNHLRECELEAALLESEQDIINGRFSTKSIAEHIESVRNG